MIVIAKVTNALVQAGWGGGQTNVVRVQVLRRATGNAGSILIAATMTVHVVDLILNQGAAYTNHKMCDSVKKSFTMKKIPRRKDQTFELSISIKYS